MIKIKIREGNTGILYITDASGNQDRYIPDRDLKESNRLLLQFYKLRSYDGQYIKDSFRKDGINWFPTTIAMLHWHILYMYVQYKSFLEKYPVDEYKYVFLNRDGFYKFVTLVSPDTSCMSMLRRLLDMFKIRIILFLKKLNNERVLKYYSVYPLIFFRYKTDDFRTHYIKENLDDLSVNYIEYASMDPYLFLKNLVARKPLPVIVPYKAISNDVCAEYDVPEDLPPLLNKVFRAGACKVQELIHDFRSTYNVFRKQLKNSKITQFYGIDDTNYAYPMIYACQANGIETIGHQHGANYSPWDAPYNLNGFNRDEYKWFDKLLVWGEFWKDHILSTSSAYSKEQIVVGAHMRPLALASNEACGVKGSKNILMPYEFYADTHLLGKYICALQDIGYVIYLKWRPDEQLADELDAYCLPEERKTRIVVVEEITNELMKKIDIVAASCSTIIFDAIPYMKEIWILETKFVFGEYLVEKGLAKKIRIEHLESDIKKSAPGIVDHELVKYVFSEEKLKNVLQRELHLNETLCI